MGNSIIEKLNGTPDNGEEMSLARAYAQRPPQNRAERRAMLKIMAQDQKKARKKGGKEDR